MSEGMSTDEKMDRLLEQVGEIGKQLSAIQNQKTPAERAGPSGSVERAAAEFRHLPNSSEAAFRWGFLGAWGMDTGPQGAQHACTSVHTTTLDSFLSARTPEEVAAFAGIFTQPETVRLCMCVFQHGGKIDKKALTEACELDDDSFLQAIKPLLEWHLVEWKGERVESCRQGVNFAITLTGLSLIHI